MKQVIISAAIVIICVGTAFAGMPTDKDYQNLEQVREQIVKMKREMDKFMKDILATYPPESPISSYGQDIRVDIAETPNDVIVRADLPGMTKDKIEVTLQNNRILRITGSREVSKEETAPGMIKRERTFGKFERMLELPVDCKNEGISATYKDGVLEVVIPKKDESKAKPVKVNVE